jgi:hypothetical protein
MRGPIIIFLPRTLDRWTLDPSSIVLGASVANSVEAVSVFSVAGDAAEYHINACSERGRGFAAWLIWNAIVRLKANGVRTLHLGGGVRGAMAWINSSEDSEARRRRCAPFGRSTIDPGIWSCAGRRMFLRPSLVSGVQGRACRGVNA